MDHNDYLLTNRPLSPIDTNNSMKNLKGQPKPPLDATAVYYAMQREIVAWGRWLLALGALQIFMNGFLSAPWGIIQLCVGAMSFLFRDAALFVVYATTLLWAGILNLSAGNTQWMIFAIIQGFFVIQVVRQFVRFRRVQSEMAGRLPSEQLRIHQRAALAFPWLGVLIGSLAFGGAALILADAAIFRLVVPSHLPAADFAFSLMIDFAVVSLGLNIGSLLSKFDYKFLSIIGLLADLLVLGGWVVLRFL